TEASPWFWQRVPNTSAIAHLLPMLDHEPLYSRLPIELIRAGLQPDPITWYGELPAVTEVMNVNLPFLVCPSDSLEGGDGAVPIVSSHPCVQFSNLRDWIVYARGFWISDPPGATSYAGCAGVHSGEDQVEPTRVPYRGAMLSTRRMRSSSISDGISHTILFGETLGHIDNFKRIEYHTWLFSGLARGRADLEWGAYEHAINPNFLLLGDSAYSHIAGFGATHPGVIHFSFADGSVHAVNRRIDLWAFYALCGIADGTTAHMLD
ncbi:MAG TPA: DUF1559 domain-containing protein, partial [Pirellulaceae bacterium]|nr:DUF1559 domain-containing protein [Pirellulaceae bacterium]HMP71016.1 DUF1559 domain-containing protein [Pirellulaceae bacterium]